MNGDTENGGGGGGGGYQRSSEGGEPGKIFVAGLPQDIDEKTLETAFGKYGRIAEVLVMKHKDSQVPKGFAFVTFENPDDAEDAIKGMDTKELNGRNIHCEKAVPKQDRPRTFVDRGGFRGGFRGRGGRGGGFRGRGSRGGYNSYGRDSYGGGRDSYRDDRPSYRDDYPPRDSYSSRPDRDYGQRSREDYGPPPSRSYSERDRGRDYGPPRSSRDGPSDYPPTRSYPSSREYDSRDYMSSSSRDYIPSREYPPSRDSYGAPPRDSYSSPPRRDYGPPPSSHYDSRDSYDRGPPRDSYSSRDRDLGPSRFSPRPSGGPSYGGSSYRSERTSRPTREASPGGPPPYKRSRGPEDYPPSSRGSYRGRS
ncbi:unnamed protein product [Owenia fusiformis]|uniref:Uncharacterized protein n=1 Tax=Owenia fusiformis TaxID=6347 RepID=A0A8J1UZE0_OWEFU|nr:unnamed protein product [Owenia fusiformis]